MTVWSLALLQACNGGEATAPTVPSGAKSANTGVPTGTVGATLPTPIRLLVTGSDGRTVRGVRVTWTASEDGSVNAAEAITDGNGAVSARWTLGTSAGQQTLTAQVPGLAPVIFRAIATADRAASIKLPNAAPRFSVIGDTLRFDPIVSDKFGNAVADSPAIAIESGSEFVSLAGSALVARARGVATLKLSLDTASTRVNITVDPATPIIERIAPDTIVPGAAFSVDGRNFAWLADAVELTVGGVKATVLRASPTRVDAILPLGALPCQAVGPLPVKVTVAARADQKAATVQVANRIALARGESANVLDAEQVRCTELLPPAGGTRVKYVVAVINTSVSAAATSGFELRGAGTGALAGQTAISRAPSASLRNTLNPTLLSAVQGIGGAPQLSALERTAEAQHDDYLEAQRALTNRVGSPAAAWRALQSARGAMRAAARAPSRVGDTVMVKALFTSCSAGRDIKARVVYAGSKALVLEDLQATRAGQLDAQYRQLGDEFDRVMYPLLQSRVGDPLAMDANLGGDGRVTMLFTRYVNDSLPGIAGYVSACNFYPKGTFAASNEDEVFYARVASAAESPSDWRRTMRSTVMHEAKHLASFAERFARSTPLEEAWLEESTARIAEELYSRTFANGGSWKGNVGFSTTVRCEVYQCDDRPLMMWKHFSVLQQYMRGVDTLTPIGAAASGDFTYYASGWSLVRWAADQYAGDESQWLKALVRGSAATGLANLSQLTGRSAVEMLADWALANAVDDLSGFTPMRKQLTFPSWNVADVMSGLAGTYPTSFLAAPLKASAMSFGTFALPVARLRAFSSSYFSFEGPQSGSQLLELRGENGAASPPGTLRVAIVRVE